MTLSLADNDKTNQNLTVSDQILNLNQNDMAETNYQELRLFLDILVFPRFSGEPCELNNFIAACDEVYTQYQNSTELIKKLIFRAILGKLQDKALILISSRIELDTWDKVKHILRISFTDQRLFTCLVNELHSLKPNTKETSYNFAIRCQYFRSLIITSINNDVTLSVNAKLAQIEYIEKLLLITFLKYLRYNIQTGVRLKNPTCIEEAMTYLIEEENVMSLCTETRKNSVQQVPNPVIKAPINNTFTRQAPQYGSYPFQAQPSTFGYRPNFPSQSIQITPRNLPEKKYFTNQQVFGKPKNVWKPTGQAPKEPVTPMSVVTKQSVPTRNVQQQHTTYQGQPQFRQPSTSLQQRSPNFFQPQSRPTFYAEELYFTNNPTSNEEVFEHEFSDLDQIDENDLIQDDLNLEELLENNVVEPNPDQATNFSQRASGIETT